MRHGNQVNTYQHEAQQEATNMTRTEMRAKDRSVRSSPAAWREFDGLIEALVKVIAGN